MKKGFLLALSLFLFVSVADVPAQIFLKELKETVKKEVGNRVAKEVRKQVNKGLDKVVNSVSGSQQHAQSQPAPNVKR